MGVTALDLLISHLSASAVKPPLLFAILAALLLRTITDGSSMAIGTRVFSTIDHEVCCYSKRKHQHPYCILYHSIGVIKVECQ